MLVYGCRNRSQCFLLWSAITVCGKNARGKIAIGKNVRGKIAIGKNVKSQSGKNTIGKNVIGKNVRGIDWVCSKGEIPGFSSFLSMISVD